MTSHGEINEEGNAAPASRIERREGEDFERVYIREWAEPFDAARARRLHALRIINEARIFRFDSGAGGDEVAQLVAEADKIAAYIENGIKP